MCNNTGVDDFSPPSTHHTIIATVAIAATHSLLLPLLFGWCVCLYYAQHFTKIGMYHLNFRQMIWAPFIVVADVVVVVSRYTRK